MGIIEAAKVIREQVALTESKVQRGVITPAQGIERQLALLSLRNSMFTALGIPDTVTARRGFARMCRP